MSWSKRAWIHVVFGSVNGSMRFLGTYPYPHPCGFWGLSGGSRKEDAALRCQIQEMGGSGIGGRQAGCTQFPMGVAGAGCQEQHFIHPRAVISQPSSFPPQDLEFPAGQGQVTNHRAGGSDPKSTSWEGKMIQVLSLQDLAEQ